MRTAAMTSVGNMASRNNGADTLVSLRGVSKSWDGKTRLAGVDLDVRRGDFIAITGPNGGGKTTLLRIMLRLLEPTRGTVTYFRDGKPAKELPIGYLPQKNMIDSHFPIVVSQVVRSGLVGAKTADPDGRVRQVLEAVGLEAQARQSIGELSGGQLQRALLGRAIISGPELLVLDEPLSYVDKRFEHQMYDIIKKMATDTTIVVVSHELSTLGAMATRHLLVDRTVEECPSAHHAAHYDCDEGAY